MNRLVRGTVGVILLSIAYREASKRRDLDISDRPCNELVKHARGRDESHTTGKWHQSDPETTFRYNRWMCEIAAYREHMVGTIRQLGSVGGEEMDESSEEYLGDLELADNDREIKRDDARVGGNPLINNDEGEIQKYAPSNLNKWMGWLEYAPDMRWAYLDRPLEAQ